MAGKKDVEELEAELSKVQKKTTLTIKKETGGSAALDEAQLESFFNSADDSKSTSQSDREKLGITTVMLTASDSRELIQLASTFAVPSSSPNLVPVFAPTARGPNSATGLDQANVKVQINVACSHSLLLGEIFGNKNFPKVWMTKNIIYTYTSGLWGAYFKSQSGDDWQMYLIDKRDSAALRLIPPMVIRNRGGQKISTSSTLLQSSENLYKYTLQRKCLRNLKVSPDGKHIQLSS
jgi:hypothetical protein